MRSRIFITTAMICLVGSGLLADGIPSAGAATRGDAGNSSVDRAKLARAINRLVRRPDGPPGVIVEIRRGERRTVFTAGAADISCNAVGTTACVPIRAPHTADYMRIASVSKAFSGAAALALVTAGRLSLDDTIGDRLPDLPVAWHAVTLRQLLNHTSGMPDFTASKGFAARLLAYPTAPPPPIRLLEFVKDEPLNFAPGSAYRYSNSDNVTVGLMIEAVTGRSYAKQLRRSVLSPLDLRQTYLAPEVTLPEPYMHGYVVEPDADVEDVSEVFAFGGYAWASGGIVSSTDDLNDFVAAYVGGEFAGKAARKAQFTFVADGNSSPPGPGKNAAGLALFRYKTRCGTVYGHTGSIYGYTHFIAATRDGTRSVTFSINTQADGDLIPALRRVQKRAVCFALAR